MREIKFEYMLLEDNKFIDKEILTLEDIEQKNTNEFCYEILKENEKIIKRQYTGLKDKNGVEIYEGDIIEYMTGQLKHIPTKHKVTWLKDEARFSFGCKANTQYMFYNTVVIGNIYENPELLKEINEKR